MRSKRSKKMRIKRLKNELSAFFFYKLEYVYAYELMRIDLTDYIRFGLNFCVTRPDKLIFLSKVYKSGGASGLVSSEAMLYCLEALLHILEFYLTENNYIDTPVTTSLQTLKSLLSASLTNQYTLPANQLIELTELQKALFDRAVSLPCLLANSVLLAEGAFYHDKSGLDTLLNDSHPVGPFVKVFRELLAQGTPPSRRLAVLYGFLSVVCKIEFVNSALTLLELLTKENRSEDPFLVLLLSLAFRQWTLRVRKCKNGALLNTLTRRNALAPIVDFIFARQGDPVNAVREAVMDTFELVLSLHTRSFKGKELSEPLQRLLLRILRQPLWMRNTLLLLHKFILTLFKVKKDLCSTKVIEWLLHFGFPLNEAVSPPNRSKSCLLACTLLDAARDVALTQWAGDVFATLIGKFSKEQNSDFLDWVYALFFVAEKVGGVPETLLDKVFKQAPTASVVLVKEYQKSFTDRGLPILVHAFCYVLTKVGRRRAEIPRPKAKFIRHALRCRDSKINQKAVRLLEWTLNEKPMTEVTLIDLACEMLSIGICNADQATLKQMCTSLPRIIDSVWRHQDVGRITTYRHFEFLVNVAGEILDRLHAGGLTRHISNALALLDPLTTAFFLKRLPKDPTPALRVLGNGVSRVYSNADPNECLHSAIAAGLWSGFADDREKAHQLIDSLELLTFVSPYLQLDIFHQALTSMARSTRPDINVLSGALVKAYMWDPPYSRSSVVSTSFYADLLLIDDHFCRVAAIAHHVLNHLVSQLTIAEVGRGGLLFVSIDGPFYPLINILTTILHDPQAKEPFEFLHHNPEAKETAPVSLPPESIFERLLDAALRVARICSYVVSHSSPEGILMMVDGKHGHTEVLPAGFGENEEWFGSEEFQVLWQSVDSRNRVRQEQETTTTTSKEGMKEALRSVIQRPEYLVVNCWRSMREVVHLLSGPLVLRSMECLRKPDPGPFSLGHLELIADFFIGQMIRSRHPGAFELTASGFQAFCEELLSFEEQPEISALPAEWLSVVVADLTDTTVFPVTSKIGSLPRRYLQESSLCATRRSAGLPPFILAMMVAIQKADQYQGLVKQTVEVLLKEVSHEAEANTVSSSSKQQVALSAAERRLHAMNVLRILVRDAKIGPQLGGYLEQLLICAFEGLNSSFWMIRNAALMLYSTMMERIFGVNRTRDGESKKNRMASSLFFTKFPGLRSFLLNALRESIPALSSPRIGKTKLFALLTLFKRFLPPIQQSTADGDMVQPFVPLVFGCAGAADIRIRLLAAKALVSLLQPAYLPRVARQILVYVSPHITGSSQTPIRANHLHGLLLQLLEIFKSEYWPRNLPAARDQPSSPQEQCLVEVDSLMEGLVSACMNSASSKLPPIIRQTGLACSLAYGRSHFQEQSTLKVAKNPTITSPCTLDVSAMELLIRYRGIFMRSDTGLETVIHDALEVTDNLEMKVIILGLLVARLRELNIDFAQASRLLWYEDVLDLLSIVSKPPFNTPECHEFLVLLSDSVNRLTDMVIESFDRPHRPFSQLGLFAAQILVCATVINNLIYLVGSMRLSDWLKGVIEGGKALPLHLTPLLTFYLLNSEGKTRHLLDNLVRYLDPSDLGVHWQTRMDALLAISRLNDHSKSLRCKLVNHKATNLALIRAMVTETDEEVLFMAASTVAKFLGARHKLPLEPHPTAVVGPLIEKLLRTFGGNAFHELFDWYETEYLRPVLERSGTSGADYSGVFVSEENLTCMSVVEFSIVLRNCAYAQHCCAQMKARVRSLLETEGFKVSEAHWPSDERERVVNHLRLLFNSILETW